MSMMRVLAVVAATGFSALAAAPSPAAPRSPSTTVPVPNVVGRTESRAQCALAAVGLRWRYRGDTHILSRPVISCSTAGAVTPDPNVIAQSPRAATLIRPGGVVVLDDVCLRRVRHHHSPCL